jgi:tRNA pseudouridine55 synthase
VARNRRAVSGWLILDKPYGMSSTQAVGKVRWLFDAEKAGHAGTLDPLATGILPIALGEATKTVAYAQGGTKRYRFTIAWGSATSTDDAEGEIVATSAVRPAAEAIAAALPRFTGDILQRPPAFSAILVGGKRAYAMARAGETVELEPRPVRIDALTLVEHTADASTLEMVCEKGTYVRSLARDLAEALGTRGHVVMLRRTAVGAFDEGRAITLPALEAATDRDALLLPLAASLAALPELRLDAAGAHAVSTGAAVLLTGAGAPVGLPEAWASHAGRPLALGYVAKGSFHPTRVFRL